MRTSLQKVDWESKIANLTVDQMTKEFPIAVMEITDRFIPNKMIKFHDKDPPWMTPEVKIAIKPKQGIYNKSDEWEYVCSTGNEISKMITYAK